MLLDLLELRDGRRGPERRRPLRRRAPRRPRRRLPSPPRRGGRHPPLLRRRVALRRGARARSGAAWARLRGLARRGAPRRVVVGRARVVAGRALDAVGFDWYDPVASHAIRVPGRRAPDGGRDWSFGRALWDVEPHPGGAAVVVRHRGGAAPRASRCGSSRTGWRRRCGTGGPWPAADGMDRPRYVREHLGAVADAVAAGVPVRAYLHWSLVDNYEWGTYEPRFGLFGMDRSDPAAVRWMDTDAQGDDAAGEFARVRGGPARRGPLGPRAAGLSPGRSAGRVARRRPPAPRPAPRSPPCSCAGGARTSTTMTTTMRPSRTSDAMPRRLLHPLPDEVAEEDVEDAPADAAERRWRPGRSR